MFVSVRFFLIFAALTGTVLFVHVRPIVLCFVVLSLSIFQCDRVRQSVDRIGELLFVRGTLRSDDACSQSIRVIAARSPLIQSPPLELAQHLT